MVRRLGFIIADQVPPNAAEEPAHADDVARIPWLLRLEWAHVHDVQPQRVGAVVADDIVGIRDVAAALGHLEAARVDEDLRIRLEPESLLRLLDVLLANAPAFEARAG